VAGGLIPSSRKALIEACLEASRAGVWWPPRTWTPPGSPAVVRDGGQGLALGIELDLRFGAGAKTGNDGLQFPALGIQERMLFVRETRPEEACGALSPLGPAARGGTGAGRELVRFAGQHVRWRPSASNALADDTPIKHHELLAEATGGDPAPLGNGGEGSLRRRCAKHSPPLAAQLPGQWGAFLNGIAG